MEAYFDSGALVKLYVKENFSDQVIRLVTRSGQVPFCALHELEICNAIRVQSGRRVIDRRQMRASLAAVAEDIEAGRLARASVDWSRVYALSETLSAKHTPRLMCRALDILHVAVALSLESKRFVTGDRRQAALARAAGLRVRAIGSR